MLMFGVYSLRNECTFFIQSKASTIVKVETIAP